MKVNKNFMVHFSAVPDHLRTKYEPEVEDKESVLSATTAHMSSESTQVYQNTDKNTSHTKNIT